MPDSSERRSPVQQRTGQHHAHRADGRPGTTSRQTARRRRRRYAAGGATIFDQTLDARVRSADTNRDTHERSPCCESCETNITHSVAEALIDSNSIRPTNSRDQRQVPEGGVQTAASPRNHAQVAHRRGQCRRRRGRASGQRFPATTDLGRRRATSKPSDPESSQEEFSSVISSVEAIP